MRKRHILLGTLALAVVVAATIGGVAYALHTRAQVQADAKSYPGLHGPVSVVCPGPTYRTAAGDGRPAIRPHNDCTPSFTQQEVRDYLAQNYRRVLVGIQASAQPTVTRVVFLTDGDLNRVGRENVLGGNWPADMLVCYAELSGTFTLYGVGPPQSVSNPSTVFDAHTGNELVWVAGPLLG